MDGNKNALLSYSESTLDVNIEVLQSSIQELQRATVRLANDDHGRFEHSVLASLRRALTRVEQHLELLSGNDDVFQYLNSITIGHMGHQNPLLHSLALDVQMIGSSLKSSDLDALLLRADVDEYISNLNRYDEILIMVWKKSKEERAEVERAFNHEALTTLLDHAYEKNRPSFDNLRVRLDRLHPIPSAFHNARGAPKPYRPGEQDEAISFVFEWAHDSDTSVLWTCSNSSSANSSFAQSIATRAHQEGRLLAAYFFSGIENDERRDPANLIPTVMYQVALSDGDHLRRIATAINIDMDIHHRDTASQISVLLNLPFRDYLAPPGPSPLIVIAALDACDNLADIEVARDLCLFIRTLALSNLRAKVVLTSRFTPDIQRLLEDPNFPRIHSLTLDRKDGLTQVEPAEDSRDFGRISSIRQITYRSQVRATGFFANMYIADVDSIGQCLVKRVPRTQADMYRRFLHEMDEYRHLALPQVRATLTLPRSKDLILMFHSIGNECMNIGYALGIGNDFWPSSGGGFYREMKGCWRSAERFLRNSELSISPIMAQTALVSSHGQMMFAFPEPKGLGSSSQIGTCKRVATTQDPFQGIDGRDSDRLIAINGTVLSGLVLRVAVVKGRISYLSRLKSFPKGDFLRTAPDSEFRLVDTESMNEEASWVTPDPSRWLPPSIVFYAEGLNRSQTTDFRMHLRDFSSTSETTSTTQLRRMDYILHSGTWWASWDEMLFPGYLSCLSIQPLDPGTTMFLSHYNSPIAAGRTTSFEYHTILDMDSIGGVSNEAWWNWLMTSGLDFEDQLSSSSTALNAGPWLLNELEQI